MSSGSASKSLELLEKTYGLSGSEQQQADLFGQAEDTNNTAPTAFLDKDLSWLLDPLPMTNQYKNWLDSLRSRISQCLEQIEFLKLIDEAVALLTQAWTQPTGTLNSTGPVIEILLQLIDQMVVPGDFTQQAEMLRSRLYFARDKMKLLRISGKR